MNQEPLSDDERYKKIEESRLAGADHAINVIDSPDLPRLAAKVTALSEDEAKWALIALADYHRKRGAKADAAWLN